MQSSRDQLMDELLAAVWMVGNMDTDEDKRAWWRTFGLTWERVAHEHGEHAQEVADRMALQADLRILERRGGPLGGADAP